VEPFTFFISYRRLVHRDAVRQAPARDHDSDQ
jgi:hypothetical protein